MSFQRLAIAVAALAAIAIVAAVAVLADSGDEEDGGGDDGTRALATERTRRASGIPVRADEPMLWGNFVVWPRADRPVELRDVELLGVEGGLRIRRLLVANGGRPSERLLATGREDFLNGFPVREWRSSFRPLRGYEVVPVEGPWDPDFGDRKGLRRTESGQFESTEVVLELEPPGPGRFRVTRGVRLHYSADGEDGHIDLPNQLTVCAPKPCKTPRPVGF